MTIIHVATGVLLLIATLSVGVWGLVRAGAIARGENAREARVFGQILQLSHTLIVATGLIGLVLWMSPSNHLADPLHARVYGPFMLVAIAAAYAYRTKNSVANVRIFAVVSLIVFLLGLRAFFTGH